MLPPISRFPFPSMTPSRLNRATLTEQIAGLIRAGVAAGRWRTRMPGQGPLAEEFGVSGKTVYGALRLLTEEGLLVADGKGRGALIAKNACARAARKTSNRVLRVAVFTMVPGRDLYPEHYLSLTRLIRDLENDGHTLVSVCFPAGNAPAKTTHPAKLVRETDADVWIVYQGTDEVLQWFAKSGITVLALGGRIGDLAIPSIATDAPGFVAHSVRRLTVLGHRRIVLITRKVSRLPTPGLMVKAFVREMEAAGVRPSEFNLPEWDETRDGLARLLDSLFRVTPPTALICLAPHSTSGVLGWLLAHGRRIPEDVSLVTLGSDAGVEWCAPGLDIVGMERNDDLYWRRVREWVADVAAGRINRESITFKFKLTDGNSVGPPSPDRG